MLAVACSGGGSGGPGVAAIGSSSSSSSSPSGSSGDAKLAFARCMRAHGMKDYPDPGSGGGSGSDLDPYDPTFEAAYQSCRSLLPAGAQTLQQIHHRLTEQGLNFARCMRAHGIAGFPDPSADGQFPESQMRGLGKGSPQFTAAQNACEHYLADNNGGGR
jgi:hypothetical protein